MDNELEGLQCGIMVGHVSSDHAWIWVLPNSSVTVEVRYESESTEPKTQRVASEDGEHQPIRVQLAGLLPNTRYQYQVFVDGKTSQIQSGEFTTAPVKGESAQFRFGVTSCFKFNGNRFTGRDRKQRAWESYLEKKLSFQVFLGDTVYSNSFDPKKQWKHHIRQRNIRSYVDVIRRIPTYATWDDHDFGPNNSFGGRANHLKRESSLAVFNEAFAMPRRNAGELKGVMNHWSWGDVDFFVLDNRYYREREKGDPILGESQLNWLREQLTQSSAKLRFVGAGTCLSRGGSGWKNSQSERDQMVEIMRNHGPTIFLSGDIHECELRTPKLEGQPSIYEFISSGIGRKNKPGQKGLRRYVTVDVDTKAKDSFVNAIIWNRKGIEVDSLRVNVSDIAL